MLRMWRREDGELPGGCPLAALPTAGKTTRLLLPGTTAPGSSLSSLVSAQQGLPAGEQGQGISLRLQTWLFVWVLWYVFIYSLFLLVY